jgi:hypothetical protein
MTSSKNYGKYIVSSLFPVIVSNESLSGLLLGTDKDISRQQRRGAIIILGMIAGAKRQIVTDRVDTLLKVGLGPRGRVRKNHCP